MSPSQNQVLIPFNVSETLSLGGTLVETLPLAKTVILGYWPVPDQTAPSQAREQFEKEAQTRLQSVADRFGNRGMKCQTRLVFTTDRSQLIDRVTNEYDCHSVLIPGTESPPSGTTRGIVLVKPNADLNQIVTTLGSLFAESDVELLLFHVNDSQNEQLYDATEYMLRGMADQLAEFGIDDDQVSWKQSTDTDRVNTIVSQVSDFDFVVLSETKPSVRERIFGPVQSKLAENTGKPVLTIRTNI